MKMPGFGRMRLPRRPGIRIRDPIAPTARVRIQDPIALAARDQEPRSGDQDPEEVPAVVKCKQSDIPGEL